MAVRARSLTVATIVLCALLAFAGAALAATVRCEGGPCVGTPGGDQMRGTPGADAIFAKAGADRVRGGGSGDRLEGGPGGDVLSGGSGADRVLGGPGDDGIAGKAGRDLLLGGRGDDEIHGSLDDEPDRFSCGPGRDRAVVGEGDTVAPDCEVVVR